MMTPNYTSEVQGMSEEETSSSDPDSDDPCRPLPEEAPT
jgi:hypothetical protein